MNSNDGDHERQIARIVRGVSITPTQTIIFAGHELQTGADKRSQLQSLLYQHCYCRRFDGTLANAVLDGTSDEFVAALSKANAAHARWSSGWTIANLNPDGTATVTRGTLAFRVWPGEYLTHHGPGIPPRLGASASIYLAKESLTLQPGFYFAFGESVQDGRETSNLVRFYWAITENAAAALVEALTERLHRFAIPFRFKCATAPSQYSRLDPAILYVDKRFYTICSTVLAHVYDSVAPSLRPQTPLFAKPLAPGLGFAEDPSNGESFGMQRCGIVCDGILEAVANGRFTEHDLLESVRQAFARRGMSLDRPYLNAGSPDTYDFHR